MFRRPKRKEGQKGFTLVELMLAMGFVGSLLVLIALIIIQIMGLYNKGLTLKEVNEVSRIVVRDMQQSISSADQLKLEYLDEDEKKSAQTLQEIVDSGSDVDYYSNPAGGRLCTGVYSYVWNTGAALASLRQQFGGSADRRTYGSGQQYPIQFMSRTNSDGSEQNAPVRFVKKRDPAKQLCRAPEDGTLASTQFDFEIGSERDYLSVFGAGNNELVPYSVSIEQRIDLRENLDSETTIEALSAFYYVNMTLGTQNGDEDTQGIISADVGCKPPALKNSDGTDATLNNSEYCAVNKISFVARTGRVGN